MRQMRGQPRILLGAEVSIPSPNCDFGGDTVTMGLLGSRFWQTAYVTSDLDQARAVFAGRLGVTNFLELRDHAYEVGPGRAARCDIALAMAGGVQLELIAPVGGDDHIYRQILRGGGGFELHHHHECQLVGDLETLEALRGEAPARDFPVVLEGSAPGGARYFYADARAVIGHLIEYIWYPPEMFAELQAAIPVN